MKTGLQSVLEKVKLIIKVIAAFKNGTKMPQFLSERSHMLALRDTLGFQSYILHIYIYIYNIFLHKQREITCDLRKARQPRERSRQDVFP